ncbi:ribosome biogenesis protein NOP53 [Aedes aegypti]|uniref:Ribosome biogenesis protein NOP53 n=1 Tax=Aedes aegypti TaxID=7159 RepID=A0A1S4FVP6_AEDAE|nr:ribosome biogenesis protein NOP53 [Aedes aegypti]
MKEKNRHISMKTKAAWRKNINISDVDSFLEEQRQEERIGTVADKSDAELFLSETIPSTEKSLKKARKDKFSASPKYCISLENSSKVPDPIVKRNRVTNDAKITKRTSQVSRLEQKKLKSLVGNHKSLRGVKNSFNKDIWAEEAVPSELKHEWFPEHVVLHHMKNTGKPLVKVAESTHAKPNAVQNVEIPASGASYNPSIDDYNELKQTVIEKERKKIKHSEHLDRVVTKKFIKMSKEEREAMVLKEMSEGLFENADKTTAAPDEEDSENEYSAVNQPVQNKKKKRSEKNRQFRAVARRNLEAITKVELKKLKDINKVKELSTELNKKEKGIAKKRENRAKRMEEKLQKPGRVAYLQYEEPEDDFLEPTELADSLRTLAPAKSLVADRFKSFQKRTLIAPKKHRDGIPRTNRSTLKKWKRYTLSTHKEAP